MPAVLGIVLRDIARNLGGDYGGCIHLDTANRWVLRPDCSDRATAWKLGGLTHRSWLILDHSDHSIRTIGTFEPIWADEWAALQRLGTDLSPEGVTAARRRDIHKQLLKFLATTGNDRLRWTKDESKIESCLQSVFIEGCLGGFPPRILPSLRAPRKRPSVNDFPNALPPAPPKRRVIMIQSNEADNGGKDSAASKVALARSLTG